MRRGGFERAAVALERGGRLAAASDQHGPAIFDQATDIDKLLIVVAEVRILLAAGHAVGAHDFDDLGNRERGSIVGLLDVAVLLDLDAPQVGFGALRVEIDLDVERLPWPQLPDGISPALEEQNTIFQRRGQMAIERAGQPIFSGEFGLDGRGRFSPPAADK